jgi:hypothetical protein
MLLTVSSESQITVDMVDCMLAFFQEHDEQLFRIGKRQTEKDYVVDYFVSLKRKRLPGNWENFDPVVLPLVRKAFTNIVAKDIVSVQPMSLPTGYTFTIDYAYKRDA